MRGSSTTFALENRMTAADADLPPYDAQRILTAPFPERVRLACLTWASQVNPNPFIVVVMYWAK